MRTDTVSRVVEVMAELVMIDIVVGWIEADGTLSVSADVISGILPEAGTRARARADAVSLPHTYEELQVDWQARSLRL